MKGVCYIKRYKPRSPIEKTGNTYNDWDYGTPDEAFVKH